MERDYFLCQLSDLEELQSIELEIDERQLFAIRQDNTLYAYLLHLIMKAKKPCLLVGEPGTAKTVTIQHYLGALDNEVNLVLGVSMSSRTSAADVRNNINDKVDKRTGKIYGPPTGKKLTVFVDDMNMPKVDTYGTQQPIALLHYLVGRGCMYSQGKDLDLRA